MWLAYKYGDDAASKIAINPIDLDAVIWRTNRKSANRAAVLSRAGKKRIYDHKGPPIFKLNANRYIPKGGNAAGTPPEP